MTPYRIETVVRESREVRRYRLVPAAGGRLPSFEAGAHVDVEVPGGIIRQYSLMNGPDDMTFLELGIKLEPESRGGSLAMHGRAHEGATILVGEPRNNFPLNGEARHHLLLAGGIGVTPLIAMARSLQASGASFALQYFVREADDVPFRDLIAETGLAAATRIEASLDPAATAAALRKQIAAVPEGTHAYICGPLPFMHCAHELASDALGPEHVHLEYFKNDAAETDGDAFTILLARTGIELRVPSDKSIIDVMLEAGLEVEASCEQGVCGTCLTDVIEGEVEHRDVYLMDAEKARNDKMTICVSRAKCGRLVLDR
jgi:vanillate O-demethylase ferredoxin subunit